MLAVPTTEESRPMMVPDQTDNHEAKAMRAVDVDVVDVEDLATSIAIAVLLEGEHS
jgi:hypothetical protein